MVITSNPMLRSRIRPINGSVAAEVTLATTPATPATLAAADGDPEAEAQFYVDENGELQDSKAGGGNLDEDEAPSAADRCR